MGEGYHLKLCANTVWGGGVLNLVVKRGRELDVADTSTVPLEIIGRPGRRRRDG